MVLTKLLTMVSVMLTCFKGKYIDFQLKLLYGKRVSLFGRGVRPPTCLSPTDTHGKRASHGKVTKVLTMVSVVLTCFRGRYIAFQLKLLYGKRVSVLGRGGPPPHTSQCLCSSW